MRERNCTCRWGNLKGRYHLEDIGRNARIILKWILNKFDRTWTGLMWLITRTSGGIL
jgi:hypothetical protein